MNDIPFLQIGIVLAVAALYVLLQVRRRAKKTRVQAAIAQGARVVDVRSPTEFHGGHYEGAINVPLDKLEKNLKSIGTKDGRVVVYCASGARSAAAERTLRSMGYTNVVNAGPLSAMP